MRSHEDMVERMVRLAHEQARQQAREAMEVYRQTIREVIKECLAGKWRKQWVSFSTWHVHLFHLRFPRLPILCIQFFTSCLYLYDYHFAYVVCCKAGPFSLTIFIRSSMLFNNIDVIVYTKDHTHCLQVVTTVIVHLDSGRTTDQVQLVYNKSRLHLLPRNGLA